MIQYAEVVANRSLCREHFRVTLRVTRFSPAIPGQFVHLCPIPPAPRAYRTLDWPREAPSDEWTADCFAPMLRRAFSIAGLRRQAGNVEIDVIYRVVGTASRWLEARRRGDQISVLGPLGNGFPIREAKRQAWLVAGGVGLPPILWFAEALAAAGRQAIAFCGARSADLMALELDPAVPPATSAMSTALSARDFARHGVPVVLSTDDGSLGFRGYVGEAVSSYAAAHPVDPGDVVVYTCGPEPLMASVARWCREHGIECLACLERAMACGTGLCQSCAVPISDDRDPHGWSYKLCCTEGPVFDARDVRW